MKKLVTGGAGFIGSHIVDRLLAEGHDVRVLDNLEQPTHRAGEPVNLPVDVEFIQGDVRNSDDLVRALAGVDVVFHEAATGGFTPHITTYIDNNITGTARLLEVIRDRKYPIEKIIVASSMGVYGEGKYECPEHGVIYPRLRSPEQLAKRRWEVECPTCGAAMAPLPVDEETPTRPERAYSVSKCAQERLVLSAGLEFGIPAVALRYFLTYGPRQSLLNPYTGICSIFSTMILNGTAPIVFEDGHQTRDFVFVDDVARANLLVMKDDRANYEVFNVSSGQAVTVGGLCQRLAGQYGRAVEPRCDGEYRLGDVRHISASIDKLKRMGFQPQVSFGQGISRYAEWIASKGEIREYFSVVEARLRETGMIRSLAT